MTRKIYLGTLLGILAVLWVALAFHPFDRSDWLLENVLTFLGIAVLVATHRVFPLSKVSYTTIFVFLCVQSLRVRGHQPLGEVAIRKMLDQKGSA